MIYGAKADKSDFNADAITGLTADADKLTITFSGSGKCGTYGTSSVTPLGNWALGSEAAANSAVACKATAQ